MADKPATSCEFEGENLDIRLDVTVSADVRAIDPVVENVMSIIRDMGCAAGREFEIETAAREALANAVIHGCKKDPHKKVQVWVGCDQARGMIIGVRDPGTGFDPRDIPSPVAAERLYATHGRGIYLINQLMDEVRFERGGTEIWMRKR
jgi:serine/threonine-protein kinase RsbW